MKKREYRGLKNYIEWGLGGHNLMYFNFILITRSPKIVGGHNLMYFYTYHEEPQNSTGNCSCDYRNIKPECTFGLTAFFILRHRDADTAIRDGFRVYG